MNNNLHELAFLIDQSSELSKSFTEAQKGFQAILDAQKKLPFDTNITVSHFGKDFANIADNVPIEKFKIKKSPFELSGTCPFVDSTVKLIDDLGARLSKTSEDQRPSKVIVILVNFGRDNASKNYTYPQLAEKIKHQTEVYKWSFYMITDFSINMEKLGIRSENTFLVKRSDKNSFFEECKNLSDAIASMRTEAAE